MPRYFFNTDDESERDAQGRELAGVSEAKCEAVMLAGRALCDNPNKFWDTGEWTMTVSNDQGLTLFSLTFFGTDAATLGQDRKHVGF